MSQIMRGHSDLELTIPCVDNHSPITPHSFPTPHSPLTPHSPSIPDEEGSEDAAGWGGSGSNKKAKHKASKSAADAGQPLKAVVDMRHMLVVACRTRSNSTSDTRTICT